MSVSKVYAARYNCKPVETTLSPNFLLIIVRRFEFVGIGACGGYIDSVSVRDHHWQTETRRISGVSLGKSRISSVFGLMCLIQLFQLIECPNQFDKLRIIKRILSLQSKCFKPVFSRP